MSREKKPEEPKQGVPAYIVTFSDMITLLLTFFVLLLSMAENQVEDHKFMAGIAAFDRAFSDFGMAGFLNSSQSSVSMDSRKPHYNVDEGQDEKENRSIDARTEMLRRVLMDIEQKMNISPSSIEGMNKEYLQTGVVFRRGSADLDDPSRKNLNLLAESIKINYSQQPPILYVLGLAGDEKKERDRWLVSVKRAQAVSDFLSEKMPPNSVRAIFCWGCGDGGEWVDYSGQVSDKTQVLVVALTESQSSY